MRMDFAHQTILFPEGFAIRGGGEKLEVLSWVCYGAKVTEVTKLTMAITTSSG